MRGRDIAEEEEREEGEEEEEEEEGKEEEEEEGKEEEFYLGGFTVSAVKPRLMCLDWLQ